MIGLLRVKNEQRWIHRCLSSILPVCESIIVMDDHSTDKTWDICASFAKVTIFASPFEDLNEQRDKNWLLDRARITDAVLMIDGDEMLMPGSAAVIEKALKTPAQCWSFRVLYLWDREDQVRADGVYGRFRRPSMFRPGQHRFESTSSSGNFHCGNAPLVLQKMAQDIDASLLHFGYLHKEDRIRKYHWYRSIDGSNTFEDGYRHLAQGDLPDIPAHLKLRHAGPLRLEELRITTTAA